MPSEQSRNVKDSLANQASSVRYIASEKFLAAVQASHRTATSNACTVAAMVRLVAMESE